MAVPLTLKVFKGDDARHLEGLRARHHQDWPSLLGAPVPGRREGQPHPLRHRGGRRRRAVHHRHGQRRGHLRQRQAGQQGALSFGDEIRVGNTTIKVEDGAAARAAAASPPPPRRRRLRCRPPLRPPPRSTPTATASPRPHAGRGGYASCGDLFCSGRRRGPAPAAAPPPRAARSRPVVARAPVAPVAAPGRRAPARLPGPPDAPEGRWTARPGACASCGAISASPSSSWAREKGEFKVGTAAGVDFIMGD